MGSERLYTTRATLQEAVDRLGSFAAISRATGEPVTTIKRRASRLGVQSAHRRSTTPRAEAEKPGVIVDGDIATITLPVGMPWSIEGLCENVGLDPDEWVALTARPNVWQGMAPKGQIVDLHQLKVELKRRIPSDMLVPARSDRVTRKPRTARRATNTAPILVALVGDQHCPHQDPDLEACWLEWCRANQPDKVIGMGDIANLSVPSRHRKNLHERHNDTPAGCFQSAHDWWANTLDACGPNTEAHQLPGNHDLRHQIACMERLPDLYDVKRPGEQYPWWDLEYLLGLDRLGVHLVRPEGEYHEARILIAPGLTLTHGAKAGPYGGAARDAPRHEGSRATGHDHKQAITHVVRYRDGEPHRHVLASVGTMARRNLGYTPDSDVHQGFGTVTIHKDGYWNIELARFDDRRKTLVWRDQRYTNTNGKQLAA